MNEKEPTFWEILPIFLKNGGGIETLKLAGCIIVIIGCIVFMFYVPVVVRWIVDHIFGPILFLFMLFTWDW